MPPLRYHRHRFPSEIIQHAIWLYLRFTLSYRDVEELLAERGLDLSYETVRRWVLKFGPSIARGLRRRRPRPSNRWHLDEMVVRIGGQQMYLWRAVDHEGEVLDMLVQRRRDSQAALRLMRKLLKKQGFAPKLLVTDKLRSYASAFRQLGLSCPHEQGLRRNNRAENSHQRCDDENGIVNLSGRGMLVVSVARQLGSGNSLTRLLCCLAQGERGRKRRPGSAKLTMPRREVLSLTPLGIAPTVTANQAKQRSGLWNSASSI
jgi:transposase-like protein